MLDSQAETFNMVPVSTEFDDFDDFQKSCRGFPTWYLSCFRSGCFKIHIFEMLGRNQQEARRKVTQIRGGITLGSVCFNLFIAS